jgi:hypothetical protein
MSLASRPCLPAPNPLAGGGQAADGQQPARARSHRAATGLSATRQKCGGQGRQARAKSTRPGGAVIIGDATMQEVLKQAKAGTTRAVIAATH